jgi:hypothetical protein
MVVIPNSKIYALQYDSIYIWESEGKEWPYYIVKAEKIKT